MYCSDQKATGDGRLYKDKLCLFKNREKWWETGKNDFQQKHLRKKNLTFKTLLI
jgi:hypothetical protein